MDVEDAAESFAALAQESRLAVLRLLRDAGPAGLPAGEIAARLGLAASTASFHLAGLERAGLLQARRQGRQIRYAPRAAALQALLGFLSQTWPGDAAAPPPPTRPTETPAMTPAFNVLFLCTHNAARSILAEALLTQLGGERFRAYSAGATPDAAPMPEVMDLLRRLGHDTAALHTKSWDVFARPGAARMDFVITLCDSLANERCPDYAEGAVTAHWPLPDPARFAGSTADRALLLGEIYGGLRRRLEIFTNLPFDGLDRLTVKTRLDRLGGTPEASASAA